ncbi:MAG: DUF4157 domain-containing protein [Anaerolinea sp.]|nr:DUF4157 domain-containing protein [Anaerolinea sp.]
MAKNDKTNSGNKTSLISEKPKPGSTNLNQVYQQTYPATIIQRSRLDPNSLTPGDVLRLQRTLGNKAVSGLLAQRAQQPYLAQRQAATQAERPIIQPKLLVGSANDQYEQEADRVAAQVLNMPAPMQTAPASNPNQAQRVNDSAPIKPLLQAKSEASFETDSAFEAQLNSQRGRGVPLPSSLRDDFEPKFGADFSGVRVHINEQSHQLNQSIQAKAFTTGQDMFFRQEAYEPGSRGGQALIAHELTHVVQQSGSTVQANDSTKVSTGTSDDGVVQRKVGYELELNAPLSRNIPQENDPVDDGAMGQLREQLQADMSGKPINGKERVYSHEQVQAPANNYMIVGDNWSENYSTSKAELVTVAPLDITVDPTKKLVEDQAVDAHLATLSTDALNMINQAKTGRQPMGNYRYGYPSDAVAQAIATPDTPTANYDVVAARSGINDNGYFQINVDFSLADIPKLRSKAKATNDTRMQIPSRKTQPGGEIKPKLFGKKMESASALLIEWSKRNTGKPPSKRQLETVNGIILQVMDTLLGAQAWNGKNLLKQLWQVAPKTPLPQLIKESRTAPGKFQVDVLDGLQELWAPIFESVLATQGIGLGDSLLPNMQEIDFNTEGFEIVADLQKISVGDYLSQVFESRYDPLIETVFRVKDKSPYVEGKEGTLPAKKLDQGKGLEAVGVYEFRQGYHVPLSDPAAITREVGSTFIDQIRDIIRG